MAISDPGKVISTILRHDNKVASYKIALLRAINDVVLSFPDLSTLDQDVAIPLRVLAEYWIAYYWVFVGKQSIPQGQFSSRSGNDIAFRPLLAEFKEQWEREVQSEALASDGFFLISELRIPRKRETFSADLLNLYEKVIKKVCQAIKQPMQYAGINEWSVFDKPSKYKDLLGLVKPIPGTKESDRCLVVKLDLWKGFRELSLWIEALCVHEWCLFTERKAENLAMNGIDRGTVYTLLTARPDNRRPLSWEHNQIDILLREGYEFICPWTEKKIRIGMQYHLEHIVPIAVYPTNELWNLVPADSHFNSTTKRDRLPTRDKLNQSRPYLELAYSLYGRSLSLDRVLREDAAVRFSTIQTNDFWRSLSNAVINLTDQIGESRNLRRF